MLNALSILFGVIAALIVLPGPVPLFGILNWLALPVAAIGAGLGALSDRNAGRNFNLVIFVLAAVRLSLGGGIL